MSTSPERRSPSLESMSSASSAFSFDDNPGITPIPNITVKSASQGGVTNFWTQAEQEDCMPESERTGRTASLRDEHSKSFKAPQASVDAYPMHERFCFPAENIYFLVEGVLYSVHRYFFERDSSSFVGQGLSKQEPMVLANVSTHDLDLFLSIFYPNSFGVHPASTVEEWSSILYLADKWSFQSIRTLAIAQIAPIASPIDKIVFGRLYSINEWLASAYHAVCTRFEALTLEEGRRLGVDDVIQINSIRQDFCFVRVSESSPLKLYEEDVELRFGLAMQTKHSASRKSMEDVGDRSRLDSAAEATSKKEEAARAAAIERKKRAQEAARQREAEIKSKEAAKAAEIERKKVEQQQADKKAEGLEEKKMQEQREAEAKPKEEEVAKAAEIQEDWSQLDALDRHGRKKAKIEKERDTEELAELVKQMKQQLADEAKVAEGGVAGGTSDVSRRVSITEPDGMSAVSDTSIGTPAIKKDDWSHLTPSERYSKKMAKIDQEYCDEAPVERAAKHAAEILKKAKQQMADEAKAAQEAAAQHGAGSCDACHSGPVPHVCG